MFNIFGRKPEPAQGERLVPVWRPRPGERSIPFERMQDLPFDRLTYAGRDERLMIDGVGTKTRVYEVTDSSTGEVLLTTATPANHPVSLYFASFEVIEQQKRAGDYEAAFRTAHGVLPGLRALMLQDVADSGRVVIQSSPPLDFVLRHLVFVEPHGEARRALADLQWMFTEPPEFRGWLPYVQGGLARCDLWQRVRDYLHKNPGAAQSKLGAALQHDGREITSILGDAEKRGLVRRERMGKSHAVTLA
jgi:hypothetical protein